MKVAVVGPGAMGCLYAAKLAQSGAECVLIDHSEERAKRLTRQGITIESAGERLTVPVRVVTRAPSGTSLVIVLTKAYATPTLSLPPDAAVLTLQNGLGNVETLCSMVGSQRVLAGSTSEAATLLEEGVTRHVAPGQTRFGAWTSCEPDAACDVLKRAGFDAEITPAPGQTLWEKAAVNAGINPLTALLNVPNGKLIESRETRQLLRDLVVESAKVASTEGYRFSQSLVEYTEQVCSDTAENISSMLQDIRAGRRTEIDAISGEILRRAQLASVPAPRTRVIHQLVRGLEAR
jgi:2-dehydropantoate 2-reductase